jgi:hypothetical protein
MLVGRRRAKPIFVVEVPFLLARIAIRGALLHSE